MAWPWVKLKTFGLADRGSYKLSNEAFFMNSLTVKSSLFTGHLFL